MTTKRKIVPLTLELEEQLKELAKKDNRSLSNYIQTVLEKHVQETKGNE